MEYVTTKPEFDGSQTANVYCTTNVAAWDIIEKVSYCEFDGLVMKANLDCKETWEARFNENANVFMYFGKCKAIPSEREVFCDMIEFGPVVSVNVIAEKGIAFCQFYSSEDANMACCALRFEGVTAKLKSPPKKKEIKKEVKPHVFDILQDAVVVFPKRRVKQKQKQSCTNAAM